MRFLVKISLNFLFKILLKSNLISLYFLRFNLKTCFSSHAKKLVNRKTKLGVKFIRLQCFIGPNLDTSVIFTHEQQNLKIGLSLFFQKKLDVPFCHLTHLPLHALCAKPIIYFETLLQWSFIFLAGFILRLRFLLPELQGIIVKYRTLRVILQCLLNKVNILLTAILKV